MLLNWCSVSESELGSQWGPGSTLRISGIRVIHSCLVDADPNLENLESFLAIYSDFLWRD